MFEAPPEAAWGGEAVTNPSLNFDLQPACPPPPQRRHRQSDCFPGTSSATLFSLLSLRMPGSFAVWLALRQPGQNSVVFSGFPSPPTPPMDAPPTPYPRSFFGECVEKDREGGFSSGCRCLLGQADRLQNGDWERVCRGRAQNLGLVADPSRPAAHSQGSYPSQRRMILGFLTSEYSVEPTALEVAGAEVFGAMPSSCYCTSLPATVVMRLLGAGTLPALLSCCWLPHPPRRRAELALQGHPQLSGPHIAAS